MITTYRVVETRRLRRVGRVVLGEGIDTTSGHRVLYAGSPRLLAAIARLLEAGASPAVTVPLGALADLEPSEGQR
jgi:hypothetical protein